MITVPSLKLKNYQTNSSSKIAVYTMTDSNFKNLRVKHVPNAYRLSENRAFQPGSSKTIRLNVETIRIFIHQITSNTPLSNRHLRLFAANRQQKFTWILAFYIAFNSSNSSG